MIFKGEKGSMYFLFWFKLCLVLRKFEGKCKGKKVEGKKK